MDGGSGRRLLGYFLCLLTGERCDLRVVLGQLAEQDLALAADQCRIDLGRCIEVGRRVVASGEGRAQPRDIELLGQQVAAQVIAFRRIDRGIELDQHVAGPDRLPVLHGNGAHHSGLEWLDHLGAAAGHDFSRGRRDDVDGAPPRPHQRDAEQEHDHCRGRPADW